MKRIYVIVGSVCFLCSCQTSSVPVMAMNVNLSDNLRCVYEYYQYGYNDNQTLKMSNEKNSSALEWEFTGMNTNTPIYSSGGDTGPTVKYTHTHDDGVTVLFPQGTGAHMISIWPTGISLWSKHNNLLGKQSASQFFGTCFNN